MLLAFMDRWFLEIVSFALYNCGQGVSTGFLYVEQKVMRLECSFGKDLGHFQWQSAYEVNMF